MPRERMGEVLKRFAQLVRSSGMDRVRLAIHAYTLWSYGKVGPSDVLKCTMVYDEASNGS